ncbi:MAG TPA: hypothetical protein VMJ52_15140, partial [Xanthobacteraceae bacterium]|nr:hypothetical protein [Xanthobacteraceae bacterium]
TAVTATFGTTDSGNTFDDAAGLISVLNATTNFGAHGATALTDGAGGVTLYSNDLSTNFATSFTSTGLTATNLVTTAHSLGDALTLSDGTHSSSFYYVAQNAQAADGTFNTAANLVSALNNPATSTRTFIDGAAVGAGSAYLALSNFNGPITVGGAIGAALGFPTGAVDYNVNLPLRVSGPPATATALVAGTTANTVFWYTGESGTTPPRDTATAQVGPSITIAYGMRANEQALTTLISNVALLAATTYSPTDPNAATNYQALSQHVTANLSGQPGTQQISDIESDLANAQTTVKNASDLNTLTQTTLTNMLQTIDGVNQTQVGEQILTLQNNLSASMSVTARLAQISLVNYLAPVA